MWTKCGSGERRSREMTRKIEEIITLVQMGFMKKKRRGRKEEKKEKEEKREKGEEERGTKWG